MPKGKAMLTTSAVTFFKKYLLQKRLNMGAGSRESRDIHLAPFRADPVDPKYPS